MQSWLTFKRYLWMSSYFWGVCCREWIGAFLSPPCRCPGASTQISFPPAKEKGYNTLVHVYCIGFAIVTCKNVTLAFKNNNLNLHLFTMLQCSIEDAASAVGYTIRRLVRLKKSIFSHLSREKCDSSLQAQLISFSHAFLKMFLNASTTEFCDYVRTLKF